MACSATVASSPRAILRSNHTRSASARDVDGDRSESLGALRYRGCPHPQLRDFPSSRLSVRTARRVPQSHTHSQPTCPLMRVARSRTTQRRKRRPVRS